MRAVLVASLLALPVAAQAEIEARAFLPAGYQAELRVDPTAMRDCGLFDAVERSWLCRAGRQNVRGSVSLDIDALDSVTLVGRLPHHLPTAGAPAVGRVLILPVLASW